MTGVDPNNFENFRNSLKTEIPKAKLIDEWITKGVMHERERVKSSVRKILTKIDDLWKDGIKGKYVFNWTTHQYVEEIIKQEFGKELTDG